MEGLTACGLNPGFSQRMLSSSRRRWPFSRRRHGPFLVVSALGDQELDKWEQMELKFGRLIGEDPKLTLAKIMARRDDPDVSYLDVEKSFRKTKGKSGDTILNITADLTIKQEFYASQSQKAQNLPRQRKPSILHPFTNSVTKSKEDENIVSLEAPQDQPRGYIDKKNVNFNIPLRKPFNLYNDDFEKNDSKLKIKPNMYLKMRKDSTESSSKVTLLKKPEETKMPSDSIEEKIVCENSPDMSSPSLTVLDNPDTSNSGYSIDANHQDTFERFESCAMIPIKDDNTGTSDYNLDLNRGSLELDHSLSIGLRPLMQNGVQRPDADYSSTSAHENSVSCKSDVSTNSALLQKPYRLEPSRVEVHTDRSEAASSDNEFYNYSADISRFQFAETEEIVDNDWKRAENLLQSGEKAEVELISCSSRGFLASFGSLIGFLPYRNLGTKWKFLAFESWLRKKGLDPSLYRQNLSIIGNHDGLNKNFASESNRKQERDQDLSLSDMKFEKLLEAYEEEKAKYLSSFVGQRLRVSVALTDRSSRKLMFSAKPKEKEELLEKKRSIMRKLRIGDIVECCIRKVTYFGIFVEVEGVPALIHQSEVLWDTSLDPSAFLKIGQVVKAKVHQLDFALERIKLSLKEVMPDPLLETLESFVGDQISLGGNAEAGQAEVEWADVDSLIKQLKMIDGIQNVMRGRFFLSPGLAPTFQVYMASMFDNQYKLLARYENKVQEVIVQASLDKEQMKDAILKCTNGVQ